MTMNFGAQRNEDYARVWRFSDKVEDTPVDLTGWAFELRINSAAGLSGSPLLAVGQSATPNGSIIEIDPGTDGRIGITIRQADIAALPGRRGDAIPFAYNLVATDAAGSPRVDIRGVFTVEPGV